MADILLLGGPSSGKTSLVRCLLGGPALTSNSHLDTIPTTGVELDAIRLGEFDISGGYCTAPSERFVNIREVGSSMRSMWPSYFSTCKAILYAIDGSSPSCWAESYTDLIDIVNAPSLKGKPLALLVTKGDLLFDSRSPSGDSHVAALDDIRDIVSSCFLHKIAELHLGHVSSSFASTTLSSSSVLLSSSLPSPLFSTTTGRKMPTGENAAVLEALQAMVSGRSPLGSAATVGKSTGSSSNIASSETKAAPGSDINGILRIFRANASIAFLVLSSRAGGFGTQDLLRWLSEISS